MRNELFSQAKSFVQQAVMIANGFEDGDQEKAVSRAKNAVSSAYANSTDAERQRYAPISGSAGEIAIKKGAPFEMRAPLFYFTSNVFTVFSLFPI